MLAKETNHRFQGEGALLTTERWCAHLQLCLSEGPEKTPCPSKLKLPTPVAPQTLSQTGPQPPPGQSPHSPHFQVALLQLPVVHRQDVEVLLQREGVEGQLDPVALPGEDDPGAVGVVGVAVREPGALDGAVGALHEASAALAWRRRTHAQTPVRNQQSIVAVVDL